MPTPRGLIAASAGLLALGCGQTAIAPIPRANPDRLPFASLGTEAARGYQAFHGLQHTHTGEHGDDGHGTAAEAYAYGRDRARLDFMALSAHSHMITDAGYAALARAAAKVSRPGRFVALAAQEWSSISSGGHVNLVEAAGRCDVPNGDWAAFYKDWLPRHPEIGFVQFNHPHPDNPHEFGGPAFSPVDGSLAGRVARSRVAGMALVNGPGKYPGDDMQGRPDPWDLGKNGRNYEEEYKEFLNRGWRIGAVGDADNHMPNWGMASPTRTGVWARSLTRRDVVAAFRSRRVFASWDPDVALWISANGQPMGAEVDAPDDLAIDVVVSDPTSRIDRLEILADTDGVGGKPAQVVARHPVGGSAAHWPYRMRAPGGEACVFAKVVYAGDDAWAWSSPIWIRPRAVSGVALPAFDTGDSWR